MKRFLLFAILPLLMAANATTDRILAPKKDGGAIVLQSTTTGGVATDAMSITQTGVLTNIPVSLKGATDGSPACTGCVGETIVGSAGAGAYKDSGAGATLVWNSDGTGTRPTITLSAGTWLVSGSTTIYKLAAGFDACQLYLSDGTVNYGHRNVVVNGSYDIPFTITTVVSFTGADRSIYFVADPDGGSTTLRFGVSGAGTGTGIITATRIR